MTIVVEDDDIKTCVEVFTFGIIILQLVLFFTIAGVEILFFHVDQVPVRRML